MKEILMTEKEKFLYCVDIFLCYITRLSLFWTLTQVFSCESCEIFKNNFLQNSSQRLFL